MSFPVDYQTTVDGVTIKCSKPFNELGTITVEDLREYAIAGIYDISAGRSGLSKSSLNGYIEVESNTPVQYRHSTDEDVWVNYSNGLYNPPPTAPHYGFSILVYGTEGQCIKSTTDNTRLVLDIPVHDIYADISAFTDNTVTASNDAGISAVASFTYKDSSRGSIKTVANNSVIGNLTCMDVFIYDDSNFFIFPASYVQGSPFLLTSYTFHGNTGNASGQVYNSAAVVPYYSTTYEGSSAIYAAMADDADLYNTSLSDINFAQHFVCILDAGEKEKEQTNAYVVIEYSGVWDFNGIVRYYPHDGERQALLGCANSSILFKIGDTLYKPVISQGVVIDYTDDMTAASEFDNITTVTGNNVPVTPPAPPPAGDDEDNDDPVNTTGAPFSAGLCHYYALTAGSVLLDHISEALGTWDIENTHKDLYRNLVSCKLIKPPAAIPTTGSAPFTIYGVKPQYQGADITLPVVTGNPDATFGPYTIDRKFNDFRDYAPYTRASIYLPYCGWCDLPSHVVGRKVSVHYYTDIIAATCKAVVFCGNNIVAEAAGVIGLDIPFAADNVGAKMQAVTAGMIAALGGGIQLGAGIGTMVSTKSGNGAKAALSGASQYLSGYSQMAMAFNENTTEISGKNGDGCCLSGATNIIIKIVRPKKGAYTTAPFTPPGYGHNVGFVSQKQVKVSSVSGLLIADNVDTSGISGATEAERAEIKRVLETGLIVNAAPE